jgi:hypothetical protein
VAICMFHVCRLLYNAVSSQTIKNQMSGSMMNWKQFGRKLSRHLPERTKESHEKSQSSLPLSWSRSESGTSTIQIRSITIKDNFLRLLGCGSVYFYK